MEDRAKSHASTRDLALISVNIADNNILAQDVNFCCVALHVGLGWHFVILTFILCNASVN